MLENQKKILDAENRVSRLSGALAQKLKEKFVRPSECQGKKIARVEYQDHRLILWFEDGTYTQIEAESSCDETYLVSTAFSSYSCHAMDFITQAEKDELHQSQVALQELKERIKAEATILRLAANNPQAFKEAIKRINES